MKEDTCEYHDCLYPGKPFYEWIHKLKKTIHHIDKDYENNDPENLMTVHLGCHVSLRMKGKHLSEETRRKISEALRKVAKSRKGKTQSPEQVARRVFSRRIGKKNYATIEEALIWDGKELVNINEIIEEII